MSMGGGWILDVDIEETSFGGRGREGRTPVKTWRAPAEGRGLKGVAAPQMGFRSGGVSWGAGRQWPRVELRPLDGVVAGGERT